MDLNNHRNHLPSLFRYYPHVFLAFFLALLFTFFFFFFSVVTRCIPFSLVYFILTLSVLVLIAK